MKKLIAVAALVAVMAGCSLPVIMYRSAITPDIRECMGLKGQTLRAAEDRFGKPVSMTMHVVEGKYTLVFKKGYLTATVTANGLTSDSEILSVSCSTN